MACAISRRVGSAVVRNRLRRQLREAARGAAGRGELPIGWYLVIVSPTAVGLSMFTLSEHLMAAVREIELTTAGNSDV
jgi:ribonuclease P protein component